MESEYGVAGAKVTLTVLIWMTPRFMIDYRNLTATVSPYAHIGHS